MEIETERLLLRQFRQDDIDAYAEMLSDEETMRYIGGTGDRMDAWTRMAAALGHWQLRGYGLFAVEEKTSGRFIGRIGAYNPEGWPAIELGWALVPTAQGNGYATEAARSCALWMFNELKLSEIISIIHPDNSPSIRVAERLGEGLKTRWRYKEVDTLVYAMTLADLNRT
ncbi:Acetyltransferase, GNAT family [Candidatus Phaeomarinobacter ectocarpi]|uniref:Acetyltransferase, GNAT family n=1 Tax=Candidatus Phaeomarinibacter ectocarpi TaxID=1458461 RepID=X5MAL1_9HYPH|nr:GNAT family N-acetyltransferase [Candidatus Phaeomarinobacter ectocarpi]CDO60943.1 Acetyltransferase, GNAT family [Candidatus Phaeomarinobacter ectocarpi]